MHRKILIAALAGTLAALATPALAQTAVGTALTYQGRLENNGSLFQGDLEYDVSAWNAAVNGTKIGENVLGTVGVVDGLFTISYDPTLSGYEGNVQMWLEVKVRAAGPGSWTTLPRQVVTAAPFSSATRGLYVTGSGATARVGIGSAAVGGVKLNIDETTNANAIINIDSGQNSAFVSGLQFADRGTARWNIGKNPANEFFFRDLAGLSTNVHIGSQNGPEYAAYNTQLNLIGHDINGSESTAAIVFATANSSSVWIAGTNKDGRFMFERPAGGASSVSVPSLEIRGGSDIAEPYNVAAVDGVAPRPGMVVAIDPDGTGSLRVAAGAYDRMVAGIISGANGVNTGLTLTQEGSVADGSMPIAKVGRVWCLVDADGGAITAGDLLTTSDTPGHAMKVTDFARSQGAILGKAMSSLKSGRGYVLVLVGLQ